MAKTILYDDVCSRECLWFKLVKLLDERGWYRIAAAAWIKSRRLRKNGFQEIAVRMLVWHGLVAESDHIYGAVDQVLEYKGHRYEFVFGEGNIKADAAYYQTIQWHESKPLTWSELLQLLPETPKPIIIVDLAQLELHNIDEASSLRRQLAAVLGVIRNYLWDAHLVLTNTKAGVKAWLHSFMGRSMVKVTELSTDDILRMYGVRKAILLDPNADKELDKDDVISAEAFILGGIVDKRPRPGATAQLAIEEAERRKITLRGSLVGVPNTINSITEAVLLARYVYNGDVQRALYDVIPPHEARIRAFAEIMKITRGRKGVRISWDLYKELSKWLPIRPRDFIKAARMAGAIVEEPKENCISKDQFHH